MGDRISPQGLASADGTLFAINLFLDESIDHGRDEVVSKIKRVVVGEDVWISGVPIFRTEVNSRTQSELFLFVPLTLMIVGFVVYFACGSVSSVAASLGSSGIATWVLLGIMGAAGVPLSLSTMILPSILLALGSAYVMHVLSAVDQVDMLVDVEREVVQVARPIGLSGVTTSIGFLAISTVRIDAIRELGLYGAIGVLVVLAATLSFAPAALVAFSGKRRRGFRVREIRRYSERVLFAFVLNYRVRIIVGWAIVSIICAGGLSRLHIETDIALWFSGDTTVRRAYEEIRARLAGITPVSVVISSTDGQSVLRNESLRTIFDLQEHLNQSKFVGESLSIADPLIRVHQKYGSGLESDLPSDGDLIAQYFLLLSSIDQVWDLVSRDQSRARIRLLLNENGSKKILEISESVNEWWDKHRVSGLSVVTTGIMYEFARAEEAIAYGQVGGFALALAAIATILLLVFRRIRIVVVCLIPNVLPLAIAYGLMGWMGIPLDAATICLGSLALGIAVDDTIHVASGYFDSRSNAVEYRAALRGVLVRVSPPLVFSTCAVAFGFGVLGTSDFTLIRNLGLITAAMVSICLVADLTLLPSLLLREPSPEQNEAISRGGLPAGQGIEPR